jgi:signal transduction histidine kinase
MAISITRAESLASRAQSSAGIAATRASRSKALSPVRAAARIAAEAEERRRLVETNRKLAEAQRVQTDFIATVSHDLRCPLASLREFISIVQDGLAGSLTDLQREYLGIAMRNADSLVEMIEHLLVVARIQQGSYQIVRRRVAIPEILGDDSLLKGARYGRKAVHLRVMVPPSLPEIYADPDRLLEAIRNLVDNAIKYSGDSVHITIRAAEVPDGMVEISIEDHGPGMDAAAMRSLFRRFSRGKHAGRANPGGLGLGLSIVKEIVDLHGGRIGVESKPDVGSVFRILIPCFDSREILLASVRGAWVSAMEGDEGFGLVQIGMRRCNGASPKAGSGNLRAVRDAFRLVLTPEDEMLLDWEANRRNCFLIRADRHSIGAATRKIKRSVARRLRFHSGVQVEWEKESPWVHSDDFNSPEAMVAAIMRDGLCKGGPTDA